MSAAWDFRATLVKADRRFVPHPMNHPVMVCFKGIPIGSFPKRLMPCAAASLLRSLGRREVPAGCVGLGHTYDAAGHGAARLHSPAARWQDPEGEDYQFSGTLF